MTREEVAVKVLMSYLTELKWRPDAEVELTIAEGVTEKGKAADILCTDAVKYANTLWAKLKETE